MNLENLKKFNSQIGTPSYVFDLDIFEKRVNLVKKYFGDKTGICFSIKANPFLLGRLPETFDKIEVCSPGELTICEKTGVDMSKIIFSGVNKTKADVERAADDKVGTFTAESMLHVELVNSAALSRNTVYPVLLRVTDVKGGSQFGMQDCDVIEIIKNRDSYKGIKIVGDLPIFVAMDSADAWTNPGLFYFDKNLVPEVVAGVPPLVSNSTSATSTTVILPLFTLKETA